MSELMANAPVYYALAQVYFNPVPAMSKYVDSIQDDLRREYSLYGDEDQTEFFIDVNNGDGGKPEVRQNKVWFITKSDKTCGFVLKTDSLTFHTTDYSTRDQFIPEMLKGLASVHKNVGLDHISRMGVRYLDAVWPNDSDSVEDYIVPGLHGAKFDAEKIYSMNESVYSTKLNIPGAESTMITRLYQADSELGFPPDMVPKRLVLAERFRTGEVKKHAVIDTDHYAKGQVEVDFAKLDESFRELHSVLKEVFESMTTPHAKAVWR